MIRLCMWAAAFGSGPCSEVHAQRALELDDVIESVRAHHPQIAASLARHARAQGELLAAQGGFDPLLTGTALARDGDGYGRHKLDVEVAQPTALWGLELFAGYRLGRSGDDDVWPSYDPAQTLPGGEIRGGLRVPLWRGGPIDERRARVRTTQALERAAGQDVAATLLALKLDATRAYFAWVAAGQALEVAQQLLALAETRGKQLERALEAGAVAAIDVTDNVRMRYERKERLAAARRELQRAAYALGLYYRGQAGKPEPPEPARLPDSVAPPKAEPLRVGALREQLATCHPVLRQLRAEVEALETQLRLADNRTGPLVHGELQVSRDLGSARATPVLEGTAFEAGVTISMPLVLRPERGARIAARAKLDEQKADLRWLVDQTAVEVGDLASRVRAAYERYEAALGYVEAAETLAEGERKRFQAGASNLLFVNLREQAATDAELRLIEAALEAHLARANWEALQAVSCP